MLFNSSTCRATHGKGLRFTDGNRYGRALSDRVRDHLPTISFRRDDARR